jgi:hypothetical protein
VVGVTKLSVEIEGIAISIAIAVFGHQLLTEFKYVIFLGLSELAKSVPVAI